MLDKQAMRAPTFRLSTLRLAWLVLAAWASLAQGFATGLAGTGAGAPGGDPVAVLCTSWHGLDAAGDEAPQTPLAPGLCACALACATAVALPPPAPAVPGQGVWAGFTRRADPARAVAAPRFAGPPPGRGPPADLV